MSYEVLARKWRPQQFADVVGQDHVVQTLSNAIQSNRIAHAYLFVGPRGTGKTSTARIFAKALNCEKGLSAVPCDECDLCREIMAGNSLDVMEIDGASNNSVDQVRDLRENCRYAPARGRFKVYIIDEVHMLSLAAFNALLKTLEEPPAHVKFLFATTESQKVPATILSRCQRFDLRRIAAREIIKRLAEIAEAEKVTIDDKALLAIARGAEGGLRDAESALDQIIAFRGNEIGEDDVLSVFGLVSWEALERLAGAILRGDVGELIRMVADLDQAGKDMQRLILELLEHFRNLLVSMYAGGISDSPDISEAQVAALKEQQALSDPERVLRMIQILTETESRLRYALSRRTLVETALIRCARASMAVSVDQVLAQLNQLKASLGDAGAIAPASPSAPPAAEPHAVAAPASAVSMPPAPSAPQTESGPAPSAVPDISGDEIEGLRTHWHAIVDQVGHVSPLAKNYLLDAKPVEASEDLVRIGFDPEFSGNKDKINFPRNVKAIQKVLSEVLHRSITIEFCILEAQEALPADTVIKNGRVARGKELPEKTPAEKKRAAKSRQDWLKDPVVRKTLEAFNGDIADIRE